MPKTRHSHCGHVFVYRIFHFYFWRYGKWVEVVVDDRLPTIDGKLCYMKSQENNEFWSALLEKAYAKMYGCYENLEGGTTAEALEDFTGGLTEFFDLRKVAKTTVLSQMVRGMQMGSLFACSIDADANIKELQLSNGLICGHAYSLTSLHTVKNLKGKQVPLLRLRNPWGNSREWRGAWSDGSSEWRTIDEQTKEDLGIEFAQDGEFWMTFDDFYRNFTQMEVCNLSAAVMDEIAEMTGVDVKASQTYVWKETSTDGEWSTAKGTAGGCTNNPHSFYNNPQYATYFTVPDTSLEKDGKCTVIVAVMQKYRRELKSLGKDSLPIGFAVYACDGVKYTMHPRFFVQTTPVCRSGAFINVRQVTARFRVPPGDYVTVPSTYDPNCDAEFLLRIYSNTRLMTKLLEKDPDY
ncbi:unnamed protein product [Caenorhabditis auriculariae]|uniref:Calpain catalytic domain-containing protein n=1 Tax=Caenorhabditis auriculariae TaxID=2777116 RepID=A0A8S1HTT5_9PELO|nr:unnamed protein product [Caenorhabditis auriculariae]